MRYYKDKEGVFLNASDLELEFRRSLEGLRRDGEDQKLITMETALLMPIEILMRYAEQAEQD